jgi:hypothetical protein
VLADAQEGRLDVVKLLLERGADRSLKDMEGLTALARAEARKHTAIIALLEAEPSTKPLGSTALAGAIAIIALWLVLTRLFSVLLHQSPRKKYDICSEQRLKAARGPARRRTVVCSWG